MNRHKPDWSVAKRFAECITGTSNPHLTFQTFGDSASDPKLAGWTHGTISDRAKWLVARSMNGAGVFFALNRLDGQGRRGENYSATTCFGVDLDGTPLPKKFPIEPQIIIESSPGRFHFYFLVDKFSDRNRFSDVQARLAAYYEGDAKVFDAPRVFRLPGFDHLKSGKPFRVRVIKDCDPDDVKLGGFGRYTVEEVEAAHPCEYTTPRERNEADTRTDSADWDQPANLKTADKMVRDWALSVSGNRNNDAYKIACALNDLAISPEKSVEFLHIWNDRHEDPLPDWELEHVVNSASKYKHDAAGSGAATDPKDDFADEPLDEATEVETDTEPDTEASEMVPETLKGDEVIAPRSWLYGKSYIRQFLSLTAATGGVGKSRLVMVEACSMATGRELVGIRPFGKLNVWYWNGEDPLDEIKRGLIAIRKHYDLSDLGGLMFNSGRDTPIKLAKSDRNGTKIAVPMVKAIKTFILRYKLDVLIIDPFVSSHNASENSNEAMEMVAKQWAKIADECNVAIMLVHHTRKSGNGQAATIEDARGGSALADAARVRRAINKMTKEQAASIGVEADKKGFYFSVDDANSNLTPPATSLDWYKLESVDLENAQGGQPSDKMGVATSYEYNPKAKDEVSEEEAEAVRTAIGAREHWRADQRSDDWVGHAIAKALGLILTGDHNKKNRQRVQLLINRFKDWGELKEYEGEDDTRRKRAFFKVCSSAPVECSSD